MSKRIDLSGTILGRLTVISYQGDGKYLCHCSCGNKNHITQAKYIQQKRVKSCGCIKKEQAIKIGEKHSMLTATKKLENSLYIFSCDCGNLEFIRNGRDVKAGKIKSCGCLYHHLTNSEEYKSWRCMKQRCYCKNNKDYHNYGGRGITVCERWLESFENFYEDMGERPEPKKDYSLDRINVNGDYCKENCRWATTEEQLNNTRETIYIEYNNKKLTARDWSKLTGIKPELIRRRIHSGWTPERALNYWGKDG